MAAKKYHLNFHKKVKFIGLSIGLMAIALGILLGTPRVVKLAETEIVSANNNENKAIFIPVKQKKVVTQIVRKDIAAPQFSANAALAIDLTTGEILYQKNIHNKLSPASTTKLVTALVGMDSFKQADMLTVYPDSKVGGSTMGLNIGERVSFRGLLYGMLLNSGNDAAYTIALNYPGGYAAFVEAMNQKVRQIGLENTHFQNPAGFDGVGHYSSAFDLAKIAQLAIANPHLARVVATKETLVSSTKDLNSLHRLKNLNKLLTEDGVLGIKTGFTESAGENFIGLVERNGRRVITVILNSQDRFGETKTLMDWVYQNFEWQDVLE